MIVSEIMAGKTPNPAYEGKVNTEDFLFAIDTASTQDTDENAYVAAWQFVTSAPGALNPQTEDKNYMSGPVTSKVSFKRQFSIAGDVAKGDAFIDFILGNDIKFGKGDDVKVPYTYFNMLTGVGEKGTAHLVVSEDAAGDAQATATFTLDVYVEGKPEAYTYVAPA